MTFIYLVHKKVINSFELITVVVLNDVNST